MKTEIQPRAMNSSRENILTAVQFDSLQAECHELEQLGGEAGILAGDIRRISSRLWELRQKVERALGR